MAVLRKEKPSPATDAATRNRTAVQPGRGNVMDETAVDPGARHPPQSVTESATEETNDYDIDDTNDTDIDDTYDGEVLSSSVGGVIRSGQGMNQATPRVTPTQVDSSPAGTHFFDEPALRDLRTRWDQVQTSFVDEPQHAVEQADALVGTVVKRIADQFAEEPANLDQKRGRGQNESTEELRQSFKRYRAFFDRLLAF